MINTRLVVPLLGLLAVFALGMPSAHAQSGGPAVAVSGPCIGVITAESGLFGRCDTSDSDVAATSSVVASTNFAPVGAGGHAVTPGAQPSPRSGSRLASLDTRSLSDRTLPYAAIIGALLMVPGTLARIVRRRSVALAS